ncbi:unnamed protein product [Candidula unifasciata]|uniref:C2 domain-containing protein n=1 Tax=Candidula unifasciata TaxID=100452 RepID=A0A8S3Z1G9_9EUPU|nr:unnamed protein product [Candidula unifasciata]
MFGKRKATEPGKRKGAELMSQMGLGPIPGIEDTGSMGYGDDDDDDDLEAELAALANEGIESVKKPRPKRTGNMGVVDIHQLAAVGMQDVDEDVSDTEDPDLLAELEELEDDVEEPVPSKTPQRSPIPAAASPSQKTITASPIFEPTLSSGVGPAPAPRNLPLPQKTPPPAPAAKPSPAPSPKPASAPLSSSSGGGGGAVAVLEERLNLYKQASAIAKTAGDSSKQRRLDRGIKTLTDLLKQAKAGKPINEEEIPPAVALGASVAVSDASSPSANSVPAGYPISAAPLAPPKPSPVSAAPVAPPKPSPVSAAPVAPTRQTTKQILLTRRDQYRKAALMAKQEGDMTKAGQYVRIAKQFDAVIQAADEGKPVDLSKMPPDPAELSGESTNTLATPKSTVPVQRVSNQAAGEDSEFDLPKTTAEEEKSLFNAPDAPKTIMEALTQRLEKYKTTESAAKTEGDSSKVRRMGRIVKQYEDAIKLYKAGKQVDYDNLPTPPGFAPIPVNTAASTTSPPSTQPSASSVAGAKPGPGAGASRPAPAAAARPAPAGAPSPAPAVTPRPAPPARSAPAVPQPGSSSSVPRQIQRQSSSRLHSRQEQQLAFLKERMAEFKQAAMNAKKSHDIELAKKYIRMMKGMEPMIEGCESGLPVDLSQVPPSPLESEDADKFVVVSAEDCEPTGDREEVFKTLQEDLVRQIRICVTNAQHYQKMGDVPAAAKFQKLEQNNRRDLDALKSAHRHGDPAPRFHYESRTFSMVQCNTDLGDTDLELTVVRGIQYNLPSGFSEKDMDTCVKYELGFPTEEPQTGSTGTVKDTVNPEYNETFKLQFNRKSKALLRFVERKGLKLDVLIKRGFFKGDKLLGTVNVKLQPLETKCVLHESYDLMEGRKSVGGKLEVKIRIRDPLKSKQVDEVKEKWLVIDQFIRTAGSKSQEESRAGKTQSDGTSCIEVLRFEKQMLDKQMGQLKDSLSLSQTQVLKHKSALLEEKIELQQKKLREGGIETWKAYLATVKTEAIAFEQEARQYAKLGDAQKFETLMNKKKIADKAIQAIKMKIPDA